MYFIITSPTKLKFKAIINNLEINIGGDEYSCLEISRTSKNSLNILADDRKASCFLNKDFNLFDTKELIKASVFVLNKIDPGNCYLELDDSSNKNGILISYASIFFQLETWYEKYFKAELINKESKNRYNDFKNNLKSKEFKRFVNLENLLKDTYTPKKNIVILMDIYNNSDSLFEFGQNIYKKYHKNNTSEAYSLLKPWLNKLIEDRLDGKFIRQIKWIILCKNVNTDGFSIEKTTLFKLKWIAKKQIGGSSLKLSKKDREMLTSPNYQIWKDINIKMFNDGDQKFLKHWYKKLRMERFF